MTPDELQELLIELNACDDAKHWSKDKSLATAWRTCKRGDWMLWLASRMIGQSGWPTQKQIVLAACACAATAAKYLDDQTREPAMKALRIARLWARGKATLAEVGSAAWAARVAEATALAAGATRAAEAAVWAAWAARAAGVAARAAGAASWAAGAAGAAVGAARDRSLAHSARIVRKMLKLKASKI